MPRDYYDVLGVSRSADIREIKDAYRRLAKRYHPDVSRIPGDEEKLKEINEAYGVLSDQVRRARYDRTANANFTSSGRKTENGRKYGAGQKTESEERTGADHRSATEERSRAASSRSENMDYDSAKYGDHYNPISFVKIGFGMAIVGMILVFVFSPQIAFFFLSISRAANHSAHNEVLASFLNPHPTHSPLPTYTPLPTLTPLPTHTPLPTLTPRPTYTPFPSPTPVPLAFIIQQLETQAQLVVVKNDIAMRDFHVGIDDRLCSHGADFSAQGVIEAGIDFAAIDEDRMRFDTERQVYSLQLPAPEFTSCRIEYIRLQKNTFSLCNPDWDQARIFAEAQAMAKFIEESEEDGLLSDAADRSAEILEDFVHTLTGKPVSVGFDERKDKPIMSTSCLPAVPEGWYHDISRNVWKQNEN